MTVLDKVDNMGNPWLFDADRLAVTPSLEDGISKDQECSYRIVGTKFIRDLGAKLEVHYYTVATGTVFFHRFYMFYSFKAFPLYPTAAACLFLAGKAEETPKKSSMIVSEARTILKDVDFAQFGSDPKDEILTLERILLQTLRFDLEVEHPYEFLIKYVKDLIVFKEDMNKGDASKGLLQQAWTFVNDSCCTMVCLQYEPEIVAIAMLLLSCKTGSYVIKEWKNMRPHHRHWWDAFVENLDEPTLEHICHQVLDVYQVLETNATRQSEDTNSATRP